MIGRGDRQAPVVRGQLPLRGHSFISSPATPERDAHRHSRPRTPYKDTSSASGCQRWQSLPYDQRRDRNELSGMVRELPVVVGVTMLRWSPTRQVELLVYC